MRAVAQANGGAGAADFFQRNHVRQVAHVGAAVLFGNGHAQHAQLAELLPQVHRELVGTVGFGSTGGDFSLGEGVDGIAQCIDVFAKLEVESGHIAHG